VSPTEIEMRLRHSLKELTATTPLANPDHPRAGPPGRRSRPQRLAVGAVAAALFIAAFALAVAYGPGSSDNGGSRSAIARAQTARHVAATVELRSEDLPGWPGYNTPTPDLGAAKKLAQCVGIRHSHVLPAVAVVRSKQFDNGVPTGSATTYAYSSTYVMATAAQAEQLTSFYRLPRFPSCYAHQTGAAIAAGLESTSHLLGVQVLGVGPAPPGVNTSDSQTVSTSYATQQQGATGVEHSVVRLLFMRIGRVVTFLVVSALLTAGPFPVTLFDRLAVTVSNRLVRATGAATASG
jgi:hypothetical protein